MNRIIELFKKQLNYEYLGNWEERDGNSNIEIDLIRKYLEKKGYSKRLINIAIYKLDQIAGKQNKSLYEINKEIYSLLRYGVKDKEDIKENKQTVWLIDWENPEQNDFAIAEEVTIRGQQ